MSSAPSGGPESGLRGISKTKWLGANGTDVTSTDAELPINFTTAGRGYTSRRRDVLTTYIDLLIFLSER